ncbi:hypothetical protein LZ017_21885, partial [Pelomonas sp. CA6]
LKAGSLDNSEGQVIAQGAGAQALSAQVDGGLVNGGQGLIASQGGLQLKAGALSNGGSVQSRGDLALQTEAGMTNSGTVYAQGQGQISAGGTLSHSGTMAAQGDLTVQAGAVVSSGTWAAGLKPDNTLAA